MKHELTVPRLGESINEVAIGKWLKKDGDWVFLDEALCEIESDKATLTINAPVEGLCKQVAAEGETLTIGQLIATIDPAAARPVKTEEIRLSTRENEKELPSQTVAEGWKEQPKSDQPTGYPSPAARRIIAEQERDISTIKGTGKGGRITKADALDLTPSLVPPNTEEVLSIPPDLGDDRYSDSLQRSEERQKMSPLRKTVARRLLEARQSTAMLTTFNEVDMSAVIATRKRYKDLFEKQYGVGLGLMSFFVRITAEALRKYPKINASIDDEEIVFHHYVDIGIAVATPKGLVVPVLVNADRMTFHEIEKAIKGFAERGQTGKLTLDELRGGTFTISNGGIFGSMLSTPILNPPQSAILGMHNIVDRPVAIDGKIEIRPIMYLALSYDHRLIDGADSVVFLKTIKQGLEDPSRMILGL